MEAGENLFGFSSEYLPQFPTTIIGITKYHGLTSKQHSVHSLIASNKEKQVVHR